MLRSSSFWRALVFSVSLVDSSCTAFLVVKSTPFVGRNVPREPKLYYSESEKTQTACTDEINTTELQTLYPALEPNTNGTIKVDDTHTLFYQEYGQNSSNKGALNALFLHGGPGAGCTPNHARFFDPDKYRIVLLDQRGCGQSTPRGEVERNTLQYLVKDCEALRIEFGIQRWDLILGGSWGTTLALAYAQTSPESVRAMVLRGVCLLRPCEVDWIYSSKGGAASLDPEGWKNFSSVVGVDDEEDGNGRAALTAHYDRLLGDNPIARIHAAQSWMIWEMRISSLAKRNESENETTTQPPVLVWEPEAGWSCQDNQGNRMHSTTWYLSHMLRRGISFENGQGGEVTMARRVSPVPTPADEPSKKISGEEAAKFIPAQAMLTCFYSVNERYATGNVDLLAKERINRLRSIPCIAVQGGNDTICPPDTSLDLHEVWPEMELRMPTGAGHSMYDPAITNELVRATDRFVMLLGKKGS